MKTFSCTIQKKVYQPPVMNNAKKIAFIFSRILNRFFSIFSVGYHAKVINFVHYKQDVDRKWKEAYNQPFTHFSPVDKLGITGGMRLITQSGKKKRIFFSTVLTAYHHHYRDLKRRKRNKIFIMDHLIEAINRLKKEKNALIMGHYYQRSEIQDIADYIGDSLALAQQAAKTTADIIVMCGVHFMGETAKVLCPEKKMLVPDMAAGCSLADSCPADKFEQFVKEHPGYTVISYVNTTAAVKALTDVVVTSTNARQIVESFPQDEKIIFGPDRNLGNYINSVTGRNMLVWDGACHVHEQFSVEKMVEIKKQHPQAVILAHPECKGAVLKLADVVGSTAALLKYAVAHPEKEYIVATEAGILHEMRKKCPQTTFIPAPPMDSTCGCNECNFMRLNTLEKLYNCLKDETPEITVDPAVAEKAVRPIKRMLEISAQLGL